MCSFQSSPPPRRCSFRTAAAVHPSTLILSNAPILQPNCFHPPNLALLDSRIQRVYRSNRDALALFAGTGNMPFGYDKLCDVVDGSNCVCEHDPKRFMRPMSQASFCLQPTGDTSTRWVFVGVLRGPFYEVSIIVAFAGERV